MTSDELGKATLKFFFEFRRRHLPDPIQSNIQGEHAIIGFLHSNYPRKVCSGDLSQEMGVGTGRIGNALKSLQKKGLIQRENDSEDRRKVLVSLTKKGYLLADRKKKEVEEDMRNAIEEFGVERYEAFCHEAQDLAKVLRRYLENRKEDDEE